MHELFWVRLDIRPTLADIDTLSDAQCAAYFRLYLHQSEHGSVPTDEHRLARIARTSPVKWRRHVAPAVMGLFALPLQEGRMAHPRLHQTRLEALKKCEKMAENARKKREKTDENPPPESNGNKGLVLAKAPQERESDLRSTTEEGSKESKRASPPARSAPREAPMPMQPRLPGMGTLLPDGWEPSDAGRRMAARAGHDAEKLADKFRAHHRGMGSLRADWDAAYTKWVLDEERHAGRPGMVVRAVRETPMTAAMRLKQELDASRGDRRGTVLEGEVVSRRWS